MEIISSRKNDWIRHLRALSSDGEYRRASGEYVCDGMKLLGEAQSSGALVRSILWKEKPGTLEGFSGRQAVAPADLFDYVSPMKNSPGPLFTVAIPGCGKPGPLNRVLILENVQDPGNVGTVIRTANAFRADAVILCGDCADLYHPKTVRATMGAIFRQKVLSMDLEPMVLLLREMGLPLYGAALAEDARDLRTLSLNPAAVAVGSEGNGLSSELLALCDGKIIIPMDPSSESLNAAVAASVILWEMIR